MVVGFDIKIPLRYVPAFVSQIGAQIWRAQVGLSGVPLGWKNK